MAGTVGFGQEEGRAYRGPLLLSATLALLVVLSMAAAIGTAAWIARSGDELRAGEEQEMISAALRQHRALIQSAAAHSAMQIAEAAERRGGDGLEQKDFEALITATDAMADYALLLRPDGTIALGAKITRGAQAVLPADAADTPATGDPASEHSGHGHDRLHEERSAAPLDDAIRTRRLPPEMLVALMPALQRSHPIRLDQTAAFIRSGGLTFLVALSAPRPIIRSANGAGEEQLSRLALVRCVDAAFLSSVAHAHSVSGLRVEDRMPEAERVSVELRDFRGATSAYMTWRRAAPVATAFSNALPYFGGLALALVALAAIAWRQSIASNRRLAERERQARHQAGHDALTGLHNRTAFAAALDRHLSTEGGEACILYLDLDRFKEVNDTLGHQAGDDLLVTISERLADVVGQRAALARLGGDEFAILLPCSDPEQGVALAREVASAVKVPLKIRGNSIAIHGSVGVACAPGHGQQGPELLRRADIALYEAKRRGRGLVVLFDPAMEHEIRNRKILETDLRAAFGTDQLFLAYHPIYATDGSRLLGVEALMRWRHPERGLIPPSDFIPIAEETGFIVELGAWLLEEVCQAGVRWPGLSVAANISPVQLRDPNFVRSVDALLDRTGLAPDRLVLEITEGVLIDHQDEAIEAISALQALGIKLALDDFGTGYSSLGYLKRYPFNKMKIDRSFIETLGQSAGDATIVHAIITLGSALGMSVIAEGVETPAQHRFLRAAGCNELQGFLFSKPLPPEGIDDLVNAPAVAAGQHSRADVA
jgi:diguanylate cyclase (GGDEF)-like protein